MSDEKPRRYMVGPAGGYYRGILYGEGAIVECPPSDRSKTWRLLKEGSDEPEEKVAPGFGGVPYKGFGSPPPPTVPPPAQHSHPAPEPDADEPDPKTFFGAGKSKRRGEE